MTQKKKKRPDYKSFFFFFFDELQDFIEGKSKKNKHKGQLPTSKEPKNLI